MVYILFALVFPIYSAAWMAAQAFRIRGRDDMPTPAELIAELKEQ